MLTITLKTPAHVRDKFWCEGKEAKFLSTYRILGTDLVQGKRG